MSLKVFDTDAVRAQVEWKKAYKNPRHNAGYQALLDHYADLITEARMVDPDFLKSGAADDQQDD